jgi:hypothetical protein
MTPAQLRATMAGEHAGMEQQVKRLNIKIEYVLPLRPCCRR